MSSKRLLIVAGEAPWPMNRGGRVRTGKLAETLATSFEVHVAAPRDDRGAGVVPPDAVRFHPLTKGRRKEHRLGVAPALGASLLGRAQEELLALDELVGPDVVLYAHGYLAAVGPLWHRPVIVDFMDLEGRRTASSLRRGELRYRKRKAKELVKALLWEPRVARRCDIALAVSRTDLAWLRRMGAKSVLVPHGSDEPPAPPSPISGPVLFVGNVMYGPNRDAARDLVERIWPMVRRSVPEARLSICGTGTADLPFDRDEGASVKIEGEVSDLGPFFEAASCVVAPVRTGGGTQLKVVDALARGRVVASTPFSARSVPPGGEEGCAVGRGSKGLARAIIGLLSDVPRRHEGERMLREVRPVPTWATACHPLLDAIDHLTPKA